MEFETINKETKLPGIAEFSRLSTEKQLNHLHKAALFVDRHSEKGQSVNLWYLNDYFVEETLDKDYFVTDITAYKKGYSLKGTCK